ncbi:MAG: hypothetical protein NTX16_08685 [Actinobacteria bacterium]|nr:hypothetical protein [Actinomycetota bacterium]
MRVLTSRTAKLAALTGLVAPAMAALTITGAGASFTAPPYYGCSRASRARSCRRGSPASIGITLDTHSHVMPSMQEVAAEKLDARL